jgi:hypothetical protein
LDTSTYKHKATISGNLKQTIIKMKLFILGLLLILTNSTFGQKKQFNIYTDERIELLNTIQYLSDYEILNPSNSLDYKVAINKYFKDFKNHSAVLLNKLISSNYFSFDNPVNFILHYKLPNFELITPFTSDELERLEASNSTDTLNLIVTEFRKFYKETNFNKFYKSNVSLFNKIKEPIISKLRKYDVIKILENHYQTKNQSYNILLSPLLHNGGYSVDINNKGTHSLYAVIGPSYSLTDKLPIFDAETILSKYTLHEMSHSFCNPIIDRNWKELSKLDYLYKPIETAMKEQAYPNWKICLYEHLVRANEIILNEIIFGKQKSDELKSEYINKKKWIYLDIFISVIKNNYLKDKQKYKSQSDVIPLIIGKLKE